MRILFILLTFFAVNTYATSILDSKYNSIDITTNYSSGDIESTGQFYGLSFNPDNVNIVLSYSYSDIEFDEVGGISTPSLDGEGSSYSLGYVFQRYDTQQFMPYISFSSADYSFQGAQLGSTDHTTFGFLIRSIISENCVLSLGAAYSDVEDMNFSNASLIKAEKELEASNTVFSGSLEYHYGHNINLTYGLATDFDSTSLSFGLGINY